jgi:hypothetical protein
MEGLGCRTDGRGQLGGSGVRPMEQQTGVVVGAEEMDGRVQLEAARRGSGHGTEAATWSADGEHQEAHDAGGWRCPARARCSAWATRRGQRGSSSVRATMSCKTGNGSRQSIFLSGRTKSEEERCYMVGVWARPSRKKWWRGESAAGH